MKNKKITVIFTIIILILLIAGFTVNVYAADLKNGSLTVFAEYNKNPLKDIKIEIFKIAEAFDDKGVIKYNPVEDFIDALKDTEYDPHVLDAGKNAELAGLLKNYISEKEMHGTLIATGSNGQAVFPNVSAGIYLVTQNTSGNGNNSRYKVQSFIIPIPYLDVTGNAGLNYYVETHPKIERLPGMLTLTKRVTGTGAPANAIFRFTVKFTAPNDEMLDNIMLNGELLDGADSSMREVSVSLRAGQTVAFTNIPIGTKYEIVEIMAAMPEYFTFVNIINGNGTITDITAVEVIATNRYSPPPPTTESTTQPTSPPGTEPTTTAPPPGTTAPTTVPPRITTTQPTITPPPTPTTRLPRPEPTTQPAINETTTEEEIEDNTPPLIVITFPPDETTTEDEEEVEEPTPPLAVITVPTEAPPKENPGTGDSLLPGLFGFMALMLISGCIAAVISKRKNTAEK